MLNLKSISFQPPKFSNQATSIERWNEGNQCAVAQFLHCGKVAFRNMGKL